MTDEDIAAAEAHFNLWYPDTAWGFDPLCELIAQTRQAARAEAADTLKAQAAEIERLREALEWAADHEPWLVEKIYERAALGEPTGE